MKTTEIRQRFLKFFEERGHKVLPSDSLIPPAEDKSLLFTGAGMNQFKAEFTGRGRPGVTRAATSQKCLRTGDIENVGRTAFHHTFFEMLGNFSFGDYFKRDAILWAWEFLTKEMKIPADKLLVSVYEDDDEAFNIWEKEIGLDAKVIYRYGQHDNFWPADAPRLGPNGLCGPCSEIFYDWGPEAGCDRPDCQPSCDCNRFCEVWNLVFQQFERKDGGVLDPLPTRNIDTGMGLERLAAVMQGKMNNFDGDLFVPIIQNVERIVEADYAKVRDAAQGVAFRRIADHARAAVFCIGDGVLPGNTGRGYVLRKLIRRAVLDGNKLGRKTPFLYTLVPVVGKVMGDQYPEIVERRENIARLIQMEEERFLQTLEQGREMLNGFIEKMRKEKARVLPGEEAFRLFDTYGLPLDITESLLEDEGLKVDTEAFEREMTHQRELARAGTRISEDIFGSGPIVELRERTGETRFEGYTKDETDGRVIGIIAGDQLRRRVNEGDHAVIVLDRTTFYGESGGEVGDTGILEGEGVRFEVTDSQRAEGMVLHIGRVVAGRIHEEDVLSAKPDTVRRAAIRRNHTATHLLHLALREILGRHAEQSGSLVATDRLRFDFHHMQPMTPEEILLVEDHVNERVLRNDPVVWRVMPISEARALGAMALFGEKYGEEVRMLDVGGYSKELCGGLHCSATGEIGLFKILAETSVAAGIRRIEAITGMNALGHLRSKEDLLQRLSETMGAPEGRLIERAGQLSEQVKELKKDLQKARRSSAPSAAGLLANAKEIGGAKIVTAKLEDAGPDDLRGLVDQLRQLGGSTAIALISANEGRVNLIVALTKDLMDKGLHAGKIAGEAAKLVGGGGGGRPDMAQAGGKDPSGMDKALARAAELLAEKLG
jgi:alanyl-tRNA synthetase